MRMKHFSVKKTGFLSFSEKGGGIRMNEGFRKDRKAIQ